MTSVVPDASFTLDLLDDDLLDNDLLDDDLLRRGISIVC